MDAIKSFAIGWELDHPEIQSTSFAEAPKLGRADVVFLGVSAMEQFWRLAPGDEIGLFRSVEREKAAWDNLVRRVGELRQMIRRGGLLVCRLERPGRACTVRWPPSSSAFPKTNEIDGYQALAGVHKHLKALAGARMFLEPADVEVVSPSHPFSAYVGQFFWELMPTVGWPAPPGDVEVLAQAGTGEAVAAAWPGCVALCPLALSDPRREAHVLLRAAYELLEKPPPQSLEAADPAQLARVFPLPGLEELNRRELHLAKSIAELKRQRLEVTRRRSELESLWGLARPTSREQLRRVVAAALEMLGFTVRGDLGDEPGYLVIHSSEVDAAGAVLLHDRKRDTLAQPPAMRWPTGPAGPATKFYLFLGSTNPMENPLEFPPAGEVVRSGGCVVPTRELLETVRTCLGNPRLSKQAIRKALAEGTGIYQLAAPE